MSRAIEIALTLDVEFNKPSIIQSTGSLYSGLHALHDVLDVCQSHRAPGTWMVAHDIDPENQIARVFPALVRRMAQMGEIGCHFHFHENRAARTDEAFQRDGIGRATRHLRAEGFGVTSFRGGNSYLDATTLRILEDLGYTVDSSVVPGLREVSPEGLVTDHKARRSSEPYRPRPDAPWEAGGRGILEIPLSTETLLDVRTPLLSLLINRVVGINNLVLSDPDFAFERVAAIAARCRDARCLVVLSAHPYDFLADAIPADRKLAHLDRFFSLLEARGDVTFTTLSCVRQRWVEREEAARPGRSLFDVTTSDLRRVRNGVRRALGAGRSFLPGGHR